MPGNGVFSPPLHPPRPVTPTDFELEPLEPRLLLSGEFMWVAAAGGDWSNAANWQVNGAAAGSAPTAGSAVIIQGLNPGAHVDFTSGTASIASLSVTGSLNITGGSMTVTGNGSTIATGSTLSVAGGTFNLATTGTLTSQGTISIGAAGVVNVRDGTLESRDAQIQLISTAALNVGRSTSSQNPMLWLNSTTAPPSPALTATDSSLITVADGGTFRVGSSVVISGAAGLVQTGGTIDFKAINNPGAAPAPQNGFINALASTKAVAIDLQAGLMTGTGYLSSQNANLGVTLQPGGTGAYGTLELGIAGTTTFKTGAVMETEFFSTGGFTPPNYDRLVFSDPVNGTGTYRVVVEDFSVNGIAGAGYSIGDGGNFQAVTFAPNTTLTGTIRGEPLIPAGAGLYTVALYPVASSAGVTFSATSMRQNEYYIYTGAGANPANWNDAANWIEGTWNGAGDFSYANVFAGWSLNPPQTAFAPPSFFSNVLIPDSGSDNPYSTLLTNTATTFSGYGYFNSLIVAPYASLTVASGQIYVRNFVVNLIPAQQTKLEGNITMSGGAITLHTPVTTSSFGSYTFNSGTIASDSNLGIGQISATGGEVITGTGSTLSLGTGSIGGSFGLVPAAGSRIEISTGPGTFSSTNGLVIPAGITLMAQGTLNVPTLTIAGSLNTGYSTGSTYNYGTLTLNGSLVMLPTGSLSLNIAGFNATAADRLTVNGNVSLAGAFNVGFSPFYSVSTSGTIYTVLSYSGTTSGNFASTSIASGLVLRTTVAGQLIVEAAVDSGQSTGLRNGLGGLADYVRVIASHFNLTGDLNNAFTMPVVVNALDSLFGLDAAPAVANFALPTFGESGTNLQLVNNLMAAGYTVDAIAGGLTSGGLTIPDVPFNSGVFVQARYTAALLNNVGVAAGYSGPQFNTATPGLLQGLATSNTLTGTLGWLASLSATIVFGIKANGDFFVTDDTKLTLAITGAGTVSGSMTIGGQSVTASGSASGNFTVSLNPLTGTYASLATLNTNPATKLKSYATGTGSVSLTTTVGPVALSYSATYQHPGDFLSPAPTVTLTGTLRMPGLATAAAPNSIHAIALTGSYDAGTNTWTLTGGENGLSIYGHAVDASFSIALTPTSFVGSATYNLTLSFLATGGSPTVVAFAGSFNATGGTFSASGTLSGIALSTEAPTTNVMLTAGTTTMGGSLTADFSAGTLTGTITLSAATGNLVPDGKYTAVISDTNNDGTAFVLTYDVAATTFTVAADKITFTVAGIMSFSITAVTLHYDRTQTGSVQTLATFSDVDVQVLNLKQMGSTGPPNPKLTVHTVTFQQNGILLGGASATLTNIRIGDAIDLASVLVTLGSTSYVQGTSVAGSLGFTNATGKLYGGQSVVDVTLGSLAGSAALSGSPIWSLTAGSFVAKAGEAFQVTKSNVALSYDTSLDATQQIAAFSGAAVAALQISGLSTASASVTLYGNSATFGTFSLTGAAASMSAYLGFTGASLNVTGFSIQSDGSFGGTVDLGFTGIQFYPASGVTTTVGRVDYSRYDFANGAASTGALFIGLTNIQISLGSMLSLTVGSAELLPGQTTFTTLTNATLTSPRISGASLTLASQALTRTGFTLGTFDIATVAATIAPIANVTDVHVIGTNVAYSTAGGVSGSVNFTAAGLALFPSNTRFTAAATGITGSFDLTGGTVGALTISVATFRVTLAQGNLVFATNNVTITPDASRVVTVGLVSVTVKLQGSTTITGSGGNFAFNSNGTVTTLPGFGVALSTNSSLASLNFPGWIQITLNSLGVSWADFANDPGNFDIILSATVSGIANMPNSVVVSGTINNLVISLDQLQQGHMPIVDVGSVAITISGPMFGGVASGTIALGVIKLDANNNRISPLDTTTPVADRIFYGGVTATFAFANLTGLTLSFGLSQYGPLNVYVGAATDILVDAASGLTLSGLRAQVVFNSSLPAFTDPTQLESSIVTFTPVTAMTNTQWLAQLEAETYAQAQAPPSGGFWGAFSQTMLIKGSADFRSAYSPTTVFRASVDVIISTDGRMVVSGTYVMANSLQMKATLYADFTNSSAVQLMLLVHYKPATGTELTIKGTLIIGQTRTDGVAVDATHPADSVGFLLTGSVAFSIKQANPALVGSISMTFANNEIQLLVHGALTVRLLGTLAGADGVFHINLADPNDPQIWGALNIQTNFSALENYGMVITGGAYVRLNTTSVQHTVTLTVPGQTAPSNIVLDPTSFSLFIQGSIQMKTGGADWFHLSGIYGIDISGDHLLIAASGTLTIGPAAAPIITFDNDGFFLVNDAGIAAQMSITLSNGVNQLGGLQVSGGFTFQMNTTGFNQQIIAPTATYLVPSMPGGVNVYTSAPYAVVFGGVNISLPNSAVTYNASDFRFVVSTGGTFTASISGTISVKANGTTIFQFSSFGSLLINSSGVAGAFGVSETLANPTSINLPLNLNFGFQFELNTTGQAQSFNGISMAAGYYLAIQANGTLSLGGIIMQGQMLISGSATEVTISYAGFAALTVSGTAVINFSMNGNLTVVNEDATHRGVVAAISVTLGTDLSGRGLVFGVGASFLLEINSTASSRTVNGNIIAAGTYLVAASAATTITIAGVAFNSTLSFTVGASSVQMHLNGTLDLKAGTVRIYQWTVVGDVNINGSSISGSFGLAVAIGPPASANLGLTGSFSISFSNTQTTISFTGSISIAGITLSGTATLSGGANFVVVQVVADVSAKVGALTYFQFHVAGALYLNGNGVAAQVGVTLTAMPSGFGLTATSATLSINTIGTNVTLPDTTVISSGSYFRVAIAGSLTLGGFTLQGTFTVAISSTTFTFSLSATLGLGSYFSFNAAGGITFDSAGYAAAFALSLTGGSGIPGLSSSLTFVLEVNTTNGARSVPLGAGSDALEAGIYTRVRATGSINFGPFVVSGSFEFAVYYGYLNIVFNASVSFFGVTGAVTGSFSASSSGSVGTLSVGVSPISGPGFTLTGAAFTLGFNTTGVNAFTQTLYIPPHSFIIGVSGATLSIPVLGVQLKGSVNIGYDGSLFFIDVSPSSPLQVNFLNWGVVSVSGHIDSSGAFRFTGTLYLSTIGNVNIAAVAGISVSVTISNSGFSGAGTGTIWLLGTRLVDASFSVTTSSFDLTANVGFTLPGIKVTVNGSVHLTVNSSGVVGDFTASLGSKLFGGISLTGRLHFDTSISFWYASLNFSASIGGDNLGASLTGTVQTSNWGWLIPTSISISGSAWGGVYIFGHWVGATIRFTASIDITNGKGSIGIDLGITSVSVPVDLSGIIQAWSSDIAGGYAFLDINGNGVWDPATEARVPVDVDGNFNFNVGDPATWTKDAGNTYAFQDLNGNGVWDPATEARLPLENGQLPAAVLPVPVSTTVTATDPLSYLGLLQAYGTLDANGTPIVDATRGTVRVTGGNTINLTTGALTPNTTVRSLGINTAGYTGLVGAGQVVFFDTNNNGVLDPGEVSVTANSNGFFTFTPNQPQLSALGILAGYDTNHNGIIDANEGSIVMTGGVDKNNGQPVNTVVRVSAANLGTGIAVGAQPLATLQSILVARGLTGNAANVRLSLTFSLPNGISFDTIDPRTDTVLSATDRAQVQRLGSQVETYMLNASSLLAGLGVSSANAQIAALDALTDRILQNYNSSQPTIISASDRVDLTDIPTLTALLTAAAAKAGVSPVAATAAAVAQVTSALNVRAAAYAASSSDLTRDLARIDTITQGSLKTAIGQVVAGQMTTNVLVNTYTGSALVTLLTNVTLVAVVPPTLTGVTNITVPTDAPPPTLNLHLGTTTGIASSITLTASSGNTSFLPNSAIVIIGTGADRVLMINTAGLALGSTTITLTASIGGQTTVQTLNFKLTAPAPLAPSIGTQPVTAATPDIHYSYGVVAFPAVAGRTLVLTASGLPAWLTFVDQGNGIGLLSGTPTAADLGGAVVVNYAVTLTATDNTGAVATQAFTLQLIGNLVEQPAFTTTPPTGTINAGNAFVYQAAVTHGPSATSLVLTTVTALPAWLTFVDHGDGSGTLSGTPRNADAGPATITLVATDNNGIRSLQNIAVTVLAPPPVVPPASTGPSIGTIANVTLPENTSVTITITLGGTLSAAAQLSVVTSNGTLLPLDHLILSGSGATRTLTIQPVADQNGSASITLALSDNGVTVTRSFTVAVTRVDAPVVRTALPLPNITVPAGSTPVVVNLAGFFTGDGPITYVAAGSDPTLGTVVVNGSTLTLTPAAGRSGVNQITIVATNHGGNGQVYTAAGTLTVTVVPQLSVSGPQVVRTDAGNVLRFTVTLLTPSNQTVRVGYATANGTAMAGIDYVAAAGTLEFAPGITTRTIDVALVGGLLLNPGSFTLGLSGAQNASVGTGLATGTIPADRGQLAGIRSPTLELSFSFIEFIGGTTTENKDVLARLALGNEAPALVTLRLGATGLIATGAGGSGVTDSGSLVVATSLSALEGLHEIGRY